MNRTRYWAIRMLAICAALSVPGLAGAENVLDKLNEVLQHLPKPPAATQTAPAAAPVNTAMSAQAPAASATLEGVKAIIAATPAISAGPFYLGMPADKALAQMKASGLTYTSDDGPRPSMFQIRQVPNQTYISGTQGMNIDRSTPTEFRHKTTENVDMSFTMYPNPPVVMRVNRFLAFLPNQGPTVGATVTALRKKYGHESYTDGGNEMVWLLDSRGRPWSPEQVQHYLRHMKASCVTKLNNNAASMPSQVTQGLDAFTYAKAEPACRDVITITAGIYFAVPGSGVSSANSAQGGWDAVANGVIDRMEVAIYDHALAINAAIVSHEVAVRGLNQQTEQQIEKAKQRGAPNL